MKGVLNGHPFFVLCLDGNPDEVSYPDCRIIIRKRQGLIL